MTLPVSLSPFLQEQGLVLAVSGGSDSTALLVAAHEARKTAGSTCRLVAVTIDHGLRPESAAEAASVARLAKSLDIEHRTLRWSDPKPVQGIQAAARDARLALLAQAADEIGARVVLTGHTADDQAETVLMRSARGEGVGLAGIAPATLYEGRIWFARPLLQQRRAALRAMLERSAVGWIEDPSNDNDLYERVRVRRRLADPVEGAALHGAAIARAALNASARVALGEAAAGLIDRFVTLSAQAELHCAPGLIGADDAPATHALRLLVSVAGAASALPDARRSDMLLAALRRGEASQLANARLEPRGAALVIRPDRRGHSGPPEPLASPYARLLPAFDLAPAQALARLLRQSQPPPCPEHIGRRA